MANPATVDDVQARYWRPLTQQQEINAATFLADAWELLLGKRRNLEAQITAGDVSEATVSRVLNDRPGVADSTRRAVEPHRWPGRA